MIIPKIYNHINNTPAITIKGLVADVKGHAIEVIGLERFASIGARCIILSKSKEIIADVTAVLQNKTILMPYDQTTGIKSGDEVRVIATNSFIYPSNDYLGRVVNSFGLPLDSNAIPIQHGNKPYNKYQDPPPALERGAMGGIIDTGVKALNLFVPLCKGQRLGIFAGSGVGKSKLLLMLTKFTKVDVRIIALIGERGREVKEFIKSIPSDSMANTVIIASTSDESPLAKKEACYLAVTLAEYFRDCGKEVLCVIDSLTRFAMAQREIGLTSKEPPSSKGYTPSVFTELPRILERTGPGYEGQASITGVFSVLVDGDDHNDPIADSVRGIIDGHIVLSRKYAHMNRYPAVDISASLSRAAPDCYSAKERGVANALRACVNTYDQLEDLINMGLYKPGNDAVKDDEISKHAKIEKLISQNYEDKVSISEAFLQAAEIINS